jgi:feruloyl-CoA synthase
MRRRPVGVAAAEAMFDWRQDAGVWYVRSPRPLGPYPKTLTECLKHWANVAPSRVFLAQRDPARWRRLTYAEALHRVRAAAQALLDRGLTQSTPVAIVSGNSIDHALMALACLHVGIPYAPVSPLYAVSGNVALFASLQPALVFAADSLALNGGPFELARPSTFREAIPANAVDEAHEAVNADSIAKVMFTSGSTGAPKGVITTHRMLCSNQEMLRTAMPFLAAEPPVLCDWLPWNHVFGGSHNFGIVLYNGGTLYIDEGKPTAAGFAETLRNLQEIETTAYFNVPKGYEMLVPALREDRAFREHFFRRVKLLFYAAAGLNQRLWDELRELAVDACGEEILMMTGLGATESSPFALSTGIEGAAAGHVGLPAPGVELKLAPVDGKLEARLRGPNITPGFWKDPVRTANAFDEEGFYKLGDALVFADPRDPARGFRFDGRIAEDFKLSTGAWVSVGPLRAQVLTALLGVAYEAVIAGPDRDFVTALLFPLPGAAPALVRERLRGLGNGISTRIRRAMLCGDPPTIHSGELTEKGSVNQQAVLRNRAGLVEELYRGSPRTIDIES